MVSVRQEIFSEVNNDAANLTKTTYLMVVRPLNDEIMISQKYANLNVQE